MRNWSREKAVEIILYVTRQIDLADRQPQLIAEIVYRADKLHLGRYGRTVSYDTYEATERGVRAGGTRLLCIHGARDAFDCINDIVASRRSADTNRLSQTDEECMTEAVTLFKNTARAAWEEALRLGDFAWRETTTNGATFIDRPGVPMRVELLAVALSLENAAAVIEALYMGRHVGDTP